MKRKKENNPKREKKKREMKKEKTLKKEKRMYTIFLNHAEIRKNKVIRENPLLSDSINLERSLEYLSAINIRLSITFTNLSEILSKRYKNYVKLFEF